MLSGSCDVNRLCMCDLLDYRPGDEAGVFCLVKGVLEEYGLAANPDVTDSDIRNIHESYISAGGAFRVIKSSGRIIGSYGLYAISSRVCELRKMYLLQEYRGRGLGIKMMNEALDRARALGFEEMVLETNSCLKEALGLYRKYGFTEFVPEHMSDRCDIAMRRHLLQ